MKNLKTITLIITGLMTLVACGGNQESEEIGANEGAILAIRTFEDVDGVEQEEMTEVAILQGDFQTPEQAQMAAENAQWSDFSTFELDEEVDFESIDESSSFLSDQVTTVQARANRGGNRGNNRGGNRGNNRDGRDRGDNFGDNDRDGSGRGDNLRDNNQRGGRGDFRNGNGRKNDNRPSRRFRGRGHNNRGNWRPNNYYSRWNKRKAPPIQHRFYGFQQCSYRYIYSRGRCYRPISRRWNYNWSHGWGYTSTYRGRKHTRRGSQLRVRIRFFL